MWKVKKITFCQLNLVTSLYLQYTVVDLFMPSGYSRSILEWSKKCLSTENCTHLKSASIRRSR